MNQAKVMAFKVAQAPVYQFAGAAGCAGCQRMLFQQQYRVPHGGSRLRNPDTMDAAANNNDIISIRHHRGFAVQGQQAAG